MKLKYKSEEARIKEGIGRVLEDSESAERSDDTSPTLQFAALELAKIKMRKAALAPDSGESGEELLEYALGAVRETLEVEGTRMSVDVPHSELLEKTREDLRFASEEVGELRASLKQQGRNRRVEDEQGISFSGKAFELVTVGLSDEPEGLLVKPFDDEGVIDTDKLTERYEMRGEWFPLEISRLDFTFVLDDDGSIFLSTESLAGALHERAREELLTLARAIY